MAEERLHMPALKPDARHDVMVFRNHLLGRDFERVWEWLTTGVAEPARAPAGNRPR